MNHSGEASLPQREILMAKRGQLVMGDYAVANKEAAALLLAEAEQLSRHCGMVAGGDWGEYFDAVADWHPVKTWPTSFRRLLYQKKTYQGRFTLWLFLVENGMAPYIAAKWTMAAGADAYDTKAYLHVLGLVKDKENGKLDKRGYTTFMIGTTRTR